MKKTLLVLALLFASQVFAQEIVKKELSMSVSTAVNALGKNLKAKGLTVFSVINHEEAAKKVNLKMNPSVLIIFGNPKVGTLLMNSNIEWSYELPLKIAIYEDAKGKVWAQTRLLSKNMPAPGQEKKITAINGLLGKLIQIK